MRDDVAVVDGEGSLSSLDRHVVVCLDGHVGYWYKDFTDRAVAEHMVERIREGDIKVTDVSGEPTTPESVDVFECELTPNEAIEDGHAMERGE